jgi:ribosomal protein S18 acetylase RimI-like enzyme
MCTVRSARSEDVPQVVALWERAAGPTRLPGRVPEAQQLFQRDPDALLVAEIDGQIVGTLIVGWDGWRCHLYRLAVTPASRRSGVARELVVEASRRAAAGGARRLDAMVSVDNADAVAFWEQAGFDRDDEDRRWSRRL